MKRISLLLALAAISGCGDAPVGPNTVAATGTVTFEGSPLVGANVIFHPSDGSDQTLASQSVTDEAGRFELSTHIGAGKFKPGIAPGKYSVAITKLDTSNISTTLAPPKNQLPKKYATPETSGLSADVSPGKENNFEFALTSN